MINRESLRYLLSDKRYLKIIRMVLSTQLIKPSIRLVLLIFNRNIKTGLIFIDKNVKLHTKNGGQIHIENGTKILRNSDIFCGMGKVEIGKNTFISVNVVIGGGNIEIGDFVMIGPGTLITTISHLSGFEGYSHEDDNRPIKIENCVWIGGNSTVIPGVTIGHDSVIGAGSVVTKDVPPYSLVVGNPARVMKKLKHRSVEFG